MPVGSFCWKGYLFLTFFYRKRNAKLFSATIGACFNNNGATATGGTRLICRRVGIRSYCTQQDCISRCCRSSTPIQEPLHIGIGKRDTRLYFFVRTQFNGNRKALMVNIIFPVFAIARCGVNALLVDLADFGRIEMNAFLYGFDLIGQRDGVTVSGNASDDPFDDIAGNHGTSPTRYETAGHKLNCGGNAVGHFHARSIGVGFVPDFD